MKRIKERLTYLEQGEASESQRITRIELVDGVTGEVAAVIHVGKHPNDDEVLEALRYKHETDPPQKLEPRRTGASLVKV